MCYRQGPCRPLTDSYGWLIINLPQGVLHTMRLSSSSSIFVFVTLLIAGTGPWSPAAHAQTFKVLYSFTGGADGSQPHAGLVFDAAGNLYGTTRFSGAWTHGGGLGTVFKLAKNGKETVLYSFRGRPDGANPQDSVVRDANGNLYGTTYGGGPSTYGTVFKLSRTGKETVLHKFCTETGCLDGAVPTASLIRDGSGNLYGTTNGGGSARSCNVDCGTVFKVSRTGQETVLYNFTGGVDGGGPTAGLVQNASGNFYGTTYLGGNPKCNLYPGLGCGVVFKLTKSGKETVVHTFVGGLDGAGPSPGRLVRDAAGNLFGTTYSGGGNGCGGSGCGTVYKLDTAGKLTVLYRFSGGENGGGPAAVIMDKSGNLYGATEQGGGVFKLDTTGRETVLHTFTGGSDGAIPKGSLVMDAAGNLYGVTAAGGNPSCFDGIGCGVVFEITP
jgi:uncharacterized repeat protein (TIGR03803 family)